MKKHKPCSPEKARQAFDLSKKFGYEKAAIELGIAKETVRRYVRHHRHYEDISAEEIMSSNAVLRQIRERYTDKELLAIAKSGAPTNRPIIPIHNFEGQEIIIGGITDTHLGSTFTNPDFIKEAFDMFDKENVDMVCHSGDVTEGMSHRPGHIFELSHIGYDAQKEHAIEILKQWDKTPFYMIDGNHDRWFRNSNGALIVKDICDAIPNAEFLGHDEGDIKLSKNAKLKLWHGEDSSSYAISYRLQKIIESFTGGEKPSALLAGHVHKAGYFYIRHVHCFSGGAIQSQSKWMRSKRIASHSGFWIYKLTINNKGIARCAGEFFPFYV